MKKHYILIIMTLLTLHIVTATTDWNITFCNDGTCYNPMEAGSTTTDTIWNLTGYIYNNSGSIDVNETMLNTTIDNRDSDTTYTCSLPYLYLDGTEINLNETYLNATIEALDSDTAETDTLQNVTDRGKTTTNDITINGSTNTPQLKIYASATQTLDLLQTYDTTGSKQLVIEDDGKLVDEDALYLKGSKSGASAYGMYIIGISYPSSGAGAATAFQPYIYPQANLANAYGVIRLTRVGAYGGTSYNLTQLNNVFDRIDILNSNRLTNAFNYKIASPNLGTGSIGNLYGLYIQDMDDGDLSNYAIYTNLGTVHLGDNVEVTNNITMNGGNIVCTAENTLCYEDTTYTHLTNFTNDLTTMPNTINHQTNNITNTTMITYANGCYTLSNTTGLYTIC